MEWFEVKGAASRKCTTTKTSAVFITDLVDGLEES